MNLILPIIHTNLPRQIRYSAFTRSIRSYITPISFIFPSKISKIGHTSTRNPHQPRNRRHVNDPSSTPTRTSLLFQHLRNSVFTSQESSSSIDPLSLIPRRDGSGMNAHMERIFLGGIFTFDCNTRIVDESNRNQPLNHYIPYFVLHKNIIQIEMTENGKGKRKQTYISTLPKISTP
jgi:hypothetical protein